MTSSGTAGPDAVVDRPALGRLVSDPDAFASTVWSHGPLLTRSADLHRGVEDLFDTDAVDELVSERGLRTPFLRVAKDGATLGDRLFTSGGGVGAGVADQVSDDALTELFADGATLVLQALHRTWPPVVRFVQQLAADLGHPVQANAYVTPPGSRGFDDHYDVHDVFVVQVEGEKRWRIHRPVHPEPLRDQPWTDHRAAVSAEAEREPILDEVLRPGDCLYLPRGFLHSATAQGDVSVHLTLGVHVWTRMAVAEEVVRLALTALSDDADARRSLPLGADVTDAVDRDLALVREGLASALEGVAAGDVADGMLARVRSSGRAASVGPVAQLRAAERLGPADVLVVRRYLAPRLEDDGSGGAVLMSRAGRLDLRGAEVDAVRELLAHGRATAETLGDGLARALLRAAVVVPA